MRRSPLVPPIPPAIIDYVKVSPPVFRFADASHIASTYVQIRWSPLLLFLHSPRLLELPCSRSRMRLLDSMMRINVELGTTRSIGRRKLRSLAWNEYVDNTRGKGHGPSSDC